MTPASSPAAIVSSFALGFVFCAVCVIVLVLLVAARDWMDEIGQRKADAAAHDATKTRSWAERWGGRAKDVAAIEASVARGEQQVVLHALRRKPANPTRLAEFRRKHGRAS